VTLVPRFRLSGTGQTLLDLSKSEIFSRPRVNRTNGSAVKYLLEITFQRKGQDRTMAMNRATLTLAIFGLALGASFAAEPASAQFSSAQRAACGGDAQRLCASSMANPQQLSACMQSNASKVSARCRTAMGMGGGKKKKKG
jgi:hypothetical protein